MKIYTSIFNKRLFTLADSIFSLGGLGFDDGERVSSAESNFYEGWKVQIHDSSEFPEVSKKGFLVEIGQEVSVRYKCSSNSQILV